MFCISAEHHHHHHERETMTSTTTTSTTRAAADRTVATWRGIAAGWVAVGGLRTEADAVRMLALVNRVRPDHRSAIR